MATKNEKLEDITKTGPQTYRTLQEQNNLNSKVDYDMANALTRMAPIKSLYDISENSPHYVESPITNQSLPDGKKDYWGRSMFDNDYASQEEFEHLGDVRANNESWYAKLGAGIGKGVVLAGTTFLDGTLGFIYGIGDAIANIGNKDETGFETFSRLWDNTISNGLSQINKEMETLLPNYRTEEELNRAWYKNLGTVNFWADSFIKNLGFAIGAYYSGGAWNKALKAAKILKTAGGAYVTGSVLSAVNEARIEANNNTDDLYKLQKEELDDSFQKRMSELKTDEEKAEAIANYEKALKELNERKAKMGLIDFIGNTILLSLDNFGTFGKLYARGFKNAEKVLGNNISKNIIDQTIDGVKHYAYNPETVGKAVGKGLLTGVKEGNEEIAQAFISDFSGNLESYDSPDAYYNALVNPVAEQKTMDFLSAATKGFSNTYGNLDRYEEFAVGFLTGILGMPTVGKTNNSDGNTYLGKGKTVGLSGGLFGAISNAKYNNKLGQEVVDYANQYMQKYADNKRHFVQSQAFTDAMDGWAEASVSADGSVKDEAGFQYKNMEDNEDFAAITRFARMGRLDDFKEIIDRDYENISDEELDNIAKTTSRADGVSGWRNNDGSYMSETEDGRKQMREKLIEKRDKLKEEVDLYDNAVSSVRGIGNNSLSPDQESELAWLQWKIGKFDSRFKSLQKDNKGAFDAILEGLQSTKEALEESLKSFDEESDYYGEPNGGKSLEEDYKENARLLKLVNSAINSFTQLKEGKSLVDITNRKAVESFDTLTSTDFLSWFVDKQSLAAPEYEEAIRNIKDISRLAHAREDFAKRLKEFTKDPSSIQKNRDKIDEKKARQNQANAAVQQRENIREKTAEEMAALTDNELDSMLAAMEGSDESDPVYQKTKNEKDLRDAKNDMLERIENLEGFDSQAITDAEELVKESKKVSESLDQFKDLESWVYNDPDLLGADEDRLLHAKEVLKAAQQAIDDDAKEAEALSAGFDDALDAMRDMASSNPQQPSTTPKDSKEKKQAGKDTQAQVPPADTPATPVRVAPSVKKSLENLNAQAKEAFDVISRDSGIPNIPSSKKSYYDNIENVIIEVISLYNNGYTAEEIFNAVKIGKSYTIVSKVFPSFSNYMRNFINNLFNDNGVNPTPANSKSQEIARDAVTPTITLDDLEAITAEYQQYLDSREVNTDGLDDAYGYWKPQTTLLPIHPHGDYSTKYTVPVSHPLHKRITIVQKYLEDNGAYTVRDTANLTVGEKVSFRTIKDLNDKVGETVILMYDSKNRVIGDIVSRNDTGVLNNQQQIVEFIKAFEAAYKASKTDNYTSDITTTIKQTRIGKIPYDYKNGKPNMHTINEVFGDQNFQLGVALNSDYIQIDPANKKKLGPSKEEDLIRLPKNMEVGQPFIILNAGIGNRKIAVPFITPFYNPELHKDTVFTQQLIKLVESLKNVRTQKTVMEIVDKFNTLLGFPKNSEGNSSLYIQKNTSKTKVVNSLGDSKDKVSEAPGYVKFEFNDANGHKIIAFEGNPSATDFTQKIINSFKGLSIQVSRYNIQRKFEDEDYNKMIGEIAQVNLVPGTIHAVGNWFTLKIPTSIKSSAATIAEAKRKTADVTKPGAELDATSKVRSKGLFENTVTKNLYEKMWNKLPAEVQTILANKSLERLTQLMKSLEKYYKNEDFTEDPSTIITSSKKRNRLVDSIHTVQWNRESEMSWLQKALPQLSTEEHIKVVNGLIKVSQYSSPEYAWGQFKNGMIHISNNAASGTLYHEAFHAVTNTLLDEQERQTLFDAARKKYGDKSNIGLEEQLAEDFREYVQYEEKPFIGTALKIFRQLKHLIQSLFGKVSVIDNIFYRINRGQFANRSINSYREQVVPIQQYHAAKYSKENLNLEQLEYLQLRKVDDATYERLSPEQKEIFFKCM